MGYRQIEPGAGKSWKILHISITANKDTVSSIRAKGFFHSQAQLIPKFFSRIRVYNPGLHLL